MLNPNFSMEEEQNPNQSFESERKTEEEHSQDHQRNQNSTRSKGANQELEKEEETEEKVVQFLDSMDSYLILMDSLSSSLRQGWLELASARYSMGGSRVTSALFDLKLHPAATTLQVTELDGESPPQDPMVREPHFSLSSWSSSGEKCSSRETEFEEEDLQKKNSTFVLRHRGISQHSVDEECTSKGSPQSPLTVDQVQRERSKSLLVFGTLVSPKLRAAQSSFETALETLVEIANMRSLMLSAHSQIKQDMGGIGRKRSLVRRLFVFEHSQIRHQIETFNYPYRHEYGGIYSVGGFSSKQKEMSPSRNMDIICFKTPELSLEYTWGCQELRSVRRAT